MRCRFACVAGVLFATGSIVAASPAGDPVQTLDPFLVRAEATPLVKLPQTHRLKTARFAAAAVGYGDYIYVIGGANSAGTPLAEVERFDVRTGRSEPFTHLAAARQGHRAVLYQDKIYVLGGFGERLPGSPAIFESRVEIIDPATGVVTHSPAMPLPKARFACVVVEGKIHVIGGLTVRGQSLVTTNAAEVYDIAAGQWEKSVPMPTPRQAIGALVDGGFIIVPGGRSARRDLAAVEAFDPREKVWRVLPPLHATTSANSLVFAGHHLFLLGGRELMAYDLVAKASVPGGFGQQVARHSSAVRLGDKIYVIGGRASSDDSWEDALPAGTTGASGAYFSDPETESVHRAAIPPGAQFGAAELSASFAGTPDYGALDSIQVFALANTLDVQSARP